MSTVDTKNEQKKIQYFAHVHRFQKIELRAIEGERETDTEKKMNWVDSFENDVVGKYIKVENDVFHGNMLNFKEIIYEYIISGISKVSHHQ